MPNMTWDIESRSGANLRDGGAHIYAIDPTTQPLCLAYALDDGEPQLWLPSDPVPSVFFEIATAPASWRTMAHNFDFEREMYENVLVPRYGFPAIAREVQHCSQRLALANAYPAELDLLAQALGLPYRKDPAARKAMLAVSRPKANRERNATTVPTWDEDPVKLALLYERANKPDDYVAQLLQLRRDGARAAVNKFKRMLVYASPADDRMRGTLRMYGAGPGRWTGLGPQLQNLKKNESNLPLSVVESIRTGDRSGIAQYGNPLSLLGDVSRAAICAALGMELKAGDFSAVESVVLAYLAGETWKLIAFQTYLQTGDVGFEPYRVVARRMLQKPENAEITTAERQLGKGGELASGFGGSVGAWRRIVPHDPRTDEEIKAIIAQWRAAHPAIRKFWADLSRSIRVAIRTGQSILVAPPPRPPIVAAYNDGNLTLTLPSGRAITYPEARLVPGKFEDALPDVEFKDNARGQWKPYRGWFGTFVENVVQGTARDLLAAAIDRFETRGIPVVVHCHDEVTVEVPAGSLSDAEFLGILLKLPAWATGLPLGGKVHSGAHYLEAPEHPAEPLARPSPDDAVLEQAVDSYIADTRDGLELEDDDPVAAEREDDKDYIAELPDHVAPLTELATLPLTPDNKVACPYHDDIEPSLQLYPDHFHCFSCGAHGSRLDWLTKVEGMSETEAVLYIRDWPGPSSPTPRNGQDEAERLAFVKSIWTSAQPLAGSIAERYLDETRDIDVSRLPANIHGSLRFHPACVFGPGTHLPCLIALMRDPLTDAPVGIQRIALEHRDGKIEKIDRRMLGHAGVVKLWPAETTLVAGEGLETTLAAATRVLYHEAFLQPAWAAMSSEMLANLPVLPGVEQLIILVDHDDAGRAAADACVARWNHAGRTVVRLTPKRQGTDFNDLVLP
jgi:Toprim domain/CHC2 zinc finger